MSGDPPGAWGSGLFPQHVDKLTSSAVLPEVARERGYRSADTKAMLATNRTPAEA